MTQAAGKAPDHIVAATPAASDIDHTSAAQAEVRNTPASEVSRIQTAWKARSAVNTYAFIPHMEITNEITDA
jgi:hypothetical protein